jgi:hypothetical protein
LKRGLALPSETRAYVKGAVQGCCRNLRAEEEGDRPCGVVEALPFSPQWLRKAASKAKKV